jgi:hypothetical protein
MEWAELIKEVAGVGGNIGIAYLICYTVVELVKIVTIGIVGYKGLKAVGIFIKYLTELMDF